VQVAVAWPAFFAGRSLKRATANRAPGRHPMPCPCSRHPLSTRCTQRAVVFAPLGSPRAFAQNSTPPWTFGQGRTHASGWRYDSRTDPPDGARPDLAADAQATPQRPAGITTPMAAEMHGWAGSTRFVFKTDRVGKRGRAGRRTPWVGAATPWSRAVPKFLTTDRLGNGIRPAGSCPGFHFHRQHRLAVRAAGLRPRSHHHVGRSPQQNCSP
jgi:hypothetical protein